MDDVFIVSAVRTAVGKAKKGTLRNFRPDDMAAAVISEAVARSSVPPERVGEVIMGCAFPEAAQGMNVARIAGMAAGLPQTVSAMTINRFCASGIEAIALAAARIQTGMYDVAVAGGVESMSLVPMGGCRFSPNPRLTKEKPEVYTAMGNCGDNVARTFKISRDAMDEWAYESHRRAVNAIQRGAFKDQIVPLEVPLDGRVVRFDTDEGPRPDTSIEALSKLSPAFAASPKLGFCTAGNSSQTSDGAAAVCLMSARAVKEMGIQPLAAFRSYRVAAGDPSLLGPAQLVAIPAACKAAGISVEELDLIENNEAFASQCLYVIREMHFPPERVNVNGGAIALGHPLGCTGAKLSVQMVYELKARQARYGLVTLCVGGGMGVAGIFERL